jgi:hypothetical protein
MTAGHGASAAVVPSNDPCLEKLPQIDDFNDVISSSMSAHLSVMILIIESGNLTD